VVQVIGTLKSNFPDAQFGFHGHTDRGLGVANTRAAILAGAVQVQGTLLGTGERCGNVNLTTVIGSMQLREEAEFVPEPLLVGLTSLAHSTYAAFGIEEPHGAPIVGAGAFGATRQRWAQIPPSASMRYLDDPTLFFSAGRWAFRSLRRRRRR
jgi:2-isopropylmalate synthase